MDGSRTERLHKSKLAFNWWRVPITLIWCLIVVLLFVMMVLFAALLVKGVIWLMAGALPHAIYFAAVLIPTVIIKQFLI